MGNSSSVLYGHRAKLCKEGKGLLDEFMGKCARSDTTDVERTSAIQAKIDELLIEYPLPAIRLIRFDHLVGLNTFPRNPENAGLTTELDSIDRNNSFLVFISHCWMRGHSGVVTEGWDGRPHPDNAAGDKYQLCVKGIDKLKSVFAPRMKDCYVWLDFGCINQNGNPAGELEQLDKIVQCCDCIFTPIVDIDHQNWTLPNNIQNWFVDYQAKLWNEGPHAYLNRGWCRVEMLYAANIPVQENENSEVKRHTMFEAGLAYHCSKNRRPHFLYGTKEYEKHEYTPIMLPPLQHSYLTHYHPLYGNLTVASDVERIQTLIHELQPYLDANKIEVGYKGDKNESGLKDGHGIELYCNGDVYEGEYKDDKMHGYGTYRFASGKVYDGEWKTGNMNGHGTLRYADGNVYVGEWKDDKKHGKGKYQFSNGDEHEREWKEDKKHGHGTFRFADGDVYDGEYKEGDIDGQGIYRFANGSVYKGEWKNGNMTGHGILRYADGSEYEGEWKDDMKHGHGILRYANGSVYDGEFKDGNIEGGDIRSANGVVQEGEWNDNNHCCVSACFSSCFGKCIG